MSKNKPKLSVPEQLSVFEQHQLAIARRTLKLNDVFVRVLGGMTKNEARAIIKRLTGKNA